MSSSSNSSEWEGSGEMPLRLPKFRSSKKKKKNKGDGDTTSVASSASIRTQDSVGDLGSAAGYVVSKAGDLPKLHRAVWKGDLNKVKSVTKGLKSKDISTFDKEHRTPLHLSCARGLSSISIHLLTLRAAVNALDGEGATPLHKLVESGSPQGGGCLQQLLDCGADPNIHDRCGRAPLHLAARLGDVPTGIVLLERDARIDAIEMHGHTPLHLATLSGHKDFASSLIDDGACVNLTNGEGCTALMLAAMDDRIGLVELFTLSNADPGVMDNASSKAVDYARTRNHQTCVRLIEAHEVAWAKEQETLSQQPRRRSLVDPALIDGIYGSPARNTPADGPAKSEDSHSRGSQSQQLGGGGGGGGEEGEEHSWPTSDPDEDDEAEATPIKGSKVNLKAGLQKARAAHKTETVAHSAAFVAPPTIPSESTEASPEVANEVANEVPSSGSDDDDSIDLDDYLPDFGGGGYEPTAPGTPSRTARLLISGGAPAITGSPGKSPPPVVSTPTCSRLPEEGPSSPPTKADGSVVAKSPSILSESSVVVTPMSSYTPGVWSPVDDPTQPETAGLDPCGVEEENDNVAQVEKHLSFDDEHDGEEAPVINDSPPGAVNGEEAPVVGDPPPGAAAAAAAADGGGNAPVVEELDEESLTDSEWDSTSLLLPDTAAPTGDRKPDYFRYYTSDEDEEPLEGDAPAVAQSCKKENLVEGEDSLAESAEDGLETEVDQRGRKPEPALVSPAHIQVDSGLDTMTATQEHATGRPIGSLPDDVIAEAALEGDFPEELDSDDVSSGAEDLDNIEELLLCLDDKKKKTINPSPLTPGHAHSKPPTKAGNSSSEKSATTPVSPIKPPAAKEASGPGKPSPLHGRRGLEEAVRMREREDALVKPGALMKTPPTSETKPLPPLRLQPVRSQGSGSLSPLSSGVASKAVPATPTTSPNKVSAQVGVSPTSERPIGRPDDADDVVPEPLDIAELETMVTEPSRPISFETTPPRGKESITIAPLTTPIGDHVTLGFDHVTTIDAEPLGFTGGRSPVYPPLSSTLVPATPTFSSPLRLQQLYLSPPPPRPHYTESTDQGSVSDVTSIVESHDQLSESQGLASESHDLFSEPSRFSEDLPMTANMMRSMNQSMGGGASFLGSAHLSHLQESLRDARAGLVQSQDGLQASERARLTLQSRLMEAQKKQDNVLESRHLLESSKLELELKVRELSYALEQAREAHRGSEGVASQLRDHAHRLEARLVKEAESHQSAELGRREMELELRTLKIAKQQLSEEVSELGGRLQSEREGRALHEGLYKEQIRMFQSLQDESKKTSEQKSDFQTQLQVADSSRQRLEEQLSAVGKAHAQLEVELSSEQRRHEDHVSRLEVELETLKDRLQEKIEKLALSEEGLAVGRQQFEAHLAELRSKAELLSSRLDQESAARCTAEGEVTALKLRVESANSELQNALQRSAQEARMLTQQLEDAHKESSLLERDLTAARDSAHQLGSKVTSLEAALSKSRGEVRSCQALLLERTNQIAGLQREVDQRQARLVAVEEALSSEKDHVSRLESKLAAAGDRASASEAESARLAQQLEFSRSQLDEARAGSGLAQERFDSMVKTLTTEHDKSKCSLERRLSSSQQRLAATSDELAKKGAELEGQSQRLAGLQDELSGLQAETAELRDRLSATEEAYREVEGEKTAAEEQNSLLTEKVTWLEERGAGLGGEKAVLEERVAGLTATLAHTTDSSVRSAREKKSLAQKMAQLEQEVGVLQKELAEVQSEHNSELVRVEQLNQQVEHLTEVRSTLESRASGLQEELCAVSAQLETSRLTEQRATRQAEEVRGLWETEVRSRSKLGLKMLDMEKNKTDASTLVDAEKRRTRKALELKKTLEVKCDALHEKNSQLQRELGALKSQLRSNKHKLHDLSLSESQLPGMRAELEREQMAHQNELGGARRQVEELRSQLRREVELRAHVTQEAARVKEELKTACGRLSVGQAEEERRQKEVSRAEKTIRRLKEELRTLQDHVSVSMVARSELEQFKRQLEEKARQELAHKLDEVNAHLEHQSAAHEALEQMRASSHSEWRARSERACEELRGQLAQSMTDRETRVTETRRVKELYEAEVQRSERLAARFQKAKEESHDARTKLNHERNRTQQLMNSSQLVASHIVATPTPHPLTSRSNQAHSTIGTDELLYSVRSELDSSIAKHLDSGGGKVPVTTKDAVTTATRPTYSSFVPPGKHAKLAHLDSIKRNYRI